MRPRELGWIGTVALAVALGAACRDATERGARATGGAPSVGSAAGAPPPAASPGGTTPNTTAKGGGPRDGRLPPNVILISLDTLRRDHCGFHGYARTTTPFLDSLAARSLVFERAYTTMSWTLIAHMSLLSGLYPTQHGVMESQNAITPRWPMLAQRLADAGWDTFGVYNAPVTWLDPRFGFDRGFASYVGSQDAVDAGAKVDEALAGVRKNRPWFLFVHLFDIHSGNLNAPGSTIYTPPPPYDRMFLADAPERLAGIDAQQWWDVAAVGVTPAKHEALLALYDGGIRFVDDTLAAWFASFEARGLLENTIVIVTSDHGEGLRQREAFYGGHGTTYEEGLRVPLIISLPRGERAGERNDDLVSHVDIVPTLLSALGLAPDERLPGHSLVDGSRAVDEWIFTAREDSRAALRRDLKIVYRGDRPVHLFELDRDPGERSPLLAALGRDAFFARAVPLLDEALTQLGGYYDPGRAATAEELDDATKARLQGLGYGGEVGGR